MIDDERQASAIEQRDHAIGVRWIDRIGQPDVLEAGVSEHFRLAQLGAADAGGAVIDLPFRDERALVRLGVRTQSQRVPLRRIAHPLNVANGLLAVDQDRGRAQRGKLRHQSASSGSASSGSSLSPTTPPDVTSPPSNMRSCTGIARNAAALPPSPRASDFCSALYNAISASDFPGVTTST